VPIYDVFAVLLAMVVLRVLEALFEPAEYIQTPKYLSK
jgi:hypothetical protein